MYIDYAEDQAEQQQLMHMNDWEEKLALFLKFNGREVLTHAGKISNEIAMELANKEYEKFNKKKLNEYQEDDFDRFLEDNPFGKSK